MRKSRVLTFGSELAKVTATAKAKDLFNILDDLLLENGIVSTKYMRICKDGACSMSIYYAGLQSFNSIQNPEALELIVLVIGN